MKREREVKKLVEAAGLTLVSITHSGGTHLKAIVQNSGGGQFISFHALTPSDHRGEKNKLAELRRYARGVLSPVQSRSKKVETRSV